MADHRTLVCALDYSEGSEAALVRAADLAERFHAHLHLLHVQALFDTEHGSAPQPAEPEDEARARLRAFAERAVGGADVLGELAPEFTVRRSPHAADAIVSFVEAAAADLLIVGTHGRRGVRRMLIGSTAEEVVRRVDCPVLTVPNAARRTAPSPTAPVLVPVDFSAASRRALAYAKAFAIHFEAPVELVHVVEGEPYPLFYFDSGMAPVLDADVVAEHAETQLRALDDDLGGVPAARVHVRQGPAHRQIADLADERDAGLVVMATHGLSGVQHLLLGSVTERTLRYACCPILSIHTETEDEADERTEKEGAAGGVG